MEHLSMQRMSLRQIDLDFAKTHYDKIVILKVFYNVYSTSETP